MASKKTQYESASDFTVPAKNIENINVADEMENSFLEYSYSVIYSRALPDARDGLKPVHRRILYTMIENGYTPDKAHVKSARIVGTCFAKGTLIHTPEGLKPIEAFTVGDTVLTPEGETTKVTECFTIPESETVTITYGNGVQNTATTDQLVMTVDRNFEKKWVEADSLTGHIVITNKKYDEKMLKNAAEQYGKEIAEHLSISDDFITIVEKLSQPSEKTASILTRMNITFKKTFINNLNIIFIHPTDAKQLITLLEPHLNTIQKHKLHTFHEQYGTQPLKNQTVPATPIIELFTQNNIDPYHAEFVKQYGDALIHSKDEDTLLFHIDNANKNGLTELISTINPVVAENIKNLHGYRYTPVENIKLNPSHMTTYDIKVENTGHAFIADGIYYSNCMGVYHPHGDCLAGDTLIVDVEGNEHYLGELSETNKTIMVDAVDKEGKIVTAKAHSFRVGQTATTIYEITFDNGLTVKATGNHPFLSVNGEWVKTETITPGSAFRSAVYNPSIKHIELTTAVVTQIVKQEVEPTLMFDFTVDTHENLFIAHKNNGSYHMIAAHNSAIYEAMVRMAQPFSMRVPFVDGHGNFGGTPDDSPASSRYCVTGNTRLLQADGTYTRIDSLLNLTTDSEKPVDFTVVDWQGKPAHAVKGFNSGYHPTIEIKTANGLTLKGSENHPVLCLSETGVTVWKTLEEITLDDQPLTFLGKITNIVEPPHELLKTSNTITVGKQGEEDVILIPENIYSGARSNKISYIKNLLLSLETEKIDKVHHSYVFDASFTQLQELLLTLHVYSETGSTGEKHYITIYDEYNTLQLPVMNSYVGYKYLYGNRYVSSPVVNKTDAGVEQVYSIKVDSKDHSFLAGGFINHNTEARLSKQGLAFIGEIKEEAVDFVPNFDSSTVQPSVLPATFPNLLINGTSGIAVGMATNMPPHNPVEVVEAAKMIVENPDATIEQIMEHIKGPDFPTGGQIIGKDQLLEAYTVGKGLIKIRARMDVEPTSGGKHRITVYEHPYQVGFEKIIASIKDEVSKKRITGVSRVVDLTDRRLGTHLVIDVKSGTNPETVKAALYRYTPLESSFGIQNLALVNGQPKYVSLPEMLNIFVTHRKNVVTRRTQYRLNKKESRLHLVKGLLLIIADIDKAISIIRASENVDEAKTSLKKEFKIDEIQSEYVLTLQLKRLTKYDSLELNTEHDQLVKEIAELSKILNSEKTLNQLVIKEMDDVLKVIADERRTEISDMVVDNSSEKTTSEGLAVDDLPEETVYLNTKGMIENEWVKNTIVSKVVFKGSFLGITKDGQAHRMRKGDQYPGLIAVAPDFGYQGNIIIGTKEGIVKIVSSDYPSRQDDFSIINLAPKDEIVSAVWVENYKEHVATFVTTDANLLSFPLEKVNPQGRNAGGVTGIKLADKQTVLAFSATNKEAYVTTWTGVTAKTTPLSLYPVKGRGGKGMRCHKFLKGETELKYAKIAYSPVGFAGSKKAALPDISEKRDGSGTKIPNLTIVHDIKDEN